MWGFKTIDNPSESDWGGGETAEVVQLVECLITLRAEGRVF